MCRGVPAERRTIGTGVAFGLLVEVVFAGAPQALSSSSLSSSSSSPSSSLPPPPTWVFPFPLPVLFAPDGDATGAVLVPDLAGVFAGAFATGLVGVTPEVVPEDDPPVAVDDGAEELLDVELDGVESGATLPLQTGVPLEQSHITAGLGPAWIGLQPGSLSRTPVTTSGTGG